MYNHILQSDAAWLVFGINRERQTEMQTHEFMHHCITLEYHKGNPQKWHSNTYWLEEANRQMELLQNI